MMIYVIKLSLLLVMEYKIYSALTQYYRTNVHGICYIDYIYSSTVNI